MTAAFDQDAPRTRSLEERFPTLARWQKTWPDTEKQGADREDTVGEELKMREPKQIMGVPKVFLALIADLMAMLAFIACIPFILTIAKRRRSNPDCPCECPSTS